MLSRPVTKPASAVSTSPATNLQPAQIPQLGRSSTPTEDVLRCAAEDLERLFRLWQVSTYWWPTGSREDLERVTGDGAERVSVQRGSHSDRLSGHWNSVAQIESLAPAVELNSGKTKPAVTLQSFAKQLVSGISWFLGKVKVQSSRKTLRLCENLPLGDKRFIDVIQVESERFLIGGAAG